MNVPSTLGQRGRILALLAQIVIWWDDFCVAVVLGWHLFDIFCVDPHIFYTATTNLPCPWRNSYQCRMTSSCVWSPWSTLRIQHRRYQWLHPPFFCTAARHREEHTSRWSFGWHDLPNTDSAYVVLCWLMAPYLQLKMEFLSSILLQLWEEILSGRGLKLGFR